MHQRSAFLAFALASTVALAAQVERITSPAGRDSGESYLTTAPDGRVLLSWVEPTDAGHALRFAVREADGWSEPRLIAEGDNWFVNWADFPSLVVLPDGTLAAHWLVRSGKDTYDYDVVIARSTDDGRTWGGAIRPHRDGVKAEHGFVSLLAVGRDAVGAAWLDGREMKAGGHDSGRGSMTLRYAELLSDGSLAKATLLDPRVCECCQTSAAMTSDGPIVVYRDRSIEEVRDIAYVRLVEGTWSEPKPVCVDGWQVQGCPVNGPSVAASGRHVVVAWFTAAGNKGRVLLARSNDAGATFGEPVTIDAANPPGRVAVVMLEDATVWVSWLGRDQGRGAVRLRRVAANGELGEAITVATTGTARRNGFPRMTVARDGLALTWTDAGVQTAFVPTR